MRCELFGHAGKTSGNASSAWPRRLMGSVAPHSSPWRVPTQIPRDGDSRVRSPYRVKLLGRRRPIVASIPFCDRGCHQEIRADVAASALD